MASLGPKGIEEMSGHLNKYFAGLISAFLAYLPRYNVICVVHVHKYGGDIIKFAGDAIIAIWPVESNDGIFAVTKSKTS
jgi:hypothetical protein